MIHTKRKSFSRSNFPKRSETLSAILASTASQDKSSFQKKLDDLQKYNKCSRDASPVLQKPQKGIPPFRTGEGLVKRIIRFKILCCISPSLASNVVSN